MIKTLFLIAASAFVTHAAEYDCNVGCSLDANFMGPLVCGDDGLTYVNECVAFCQGIDLDSYGPCDSPLVESDLFVDSEVIDESTMKRFEDENFRFVMKRTNFATELENLEMITDPDDFVLDEMGGDRHFVRITSEGYEYASRYGLLNETVRATLPYKGLVEGYEFIVQKKRNLIVIGNDTRSAVQDTTMFPYRAIGAADFSWGDNGCTVTMISRTSALTAAHCVWNYAEAKPMPMTRIAPGRYYDPTTDDDTEPFGMWEIDYMTAFGIYRELRTTTYDMAVVTYKPINRTDLGCEDVYPGDVVGYVGIDKVNGTDTAVVDARGSSITITGYPYDFKRGEMTTSGPCSPEPRSYGPNYLRYFCDTAGGMSGSALLTSQYMAIGNHAGGLGSTNGGPVMNQEMFEAVYTWAGLANQTQQICAPNDTSVENDCPCPAGGNPWYQMLCWFLNIQGCLLVARKSVPL